jgi:serine/threonine-protein kinase
VAPWQPPAAPASLLRLSIGLGADVSLAVSSVGAGPAVALSPDGRLLAFVAHDKDKDTTRLFLRRLDQLQASPLAGTEGARDHFFSPDGQWIAFFADGQLKRVAVGGGAPVVLAEAPNDRGGTWSEDGTLLFTPNSLPSVGLSRVPASGGPTEVATHPDPAAGEVTHRWPQALSGGAVMFTAHRTLGSYEDASIVVERLPDGPRKVVVTGGYHGRYLPSGHVVYMHDGTLFALPFDLASLEAKGAAVPVIEDLVASPRTGGAQFTTSSPGTLVYLAGRGGRGRFSIQWLDRAGKLAPMRAAPGHYRNLKFSPDGTRLAMQVFDGKTSDVWVYEWGRDTMSRLTFDALGLTVPVWSPAGDGIAYSSLKGSEPGHIYWQRADGTGAPVSLTESRNFQTPDSWHPSGTPLAFHELSPQTGFDVMILPIEGGDASGLKADRATAFLNSRFNELQAAFSPNGQWLAYVSDESGKFEVYVRPFPGPGGKWQISTGGGFYPTWSRNGRELFYETPDQRLMGVSYAERPGSFLADAPRPGFPVRVPTQQGIRGFDLHPDGRRFAVLQDVEEPGAGREQVVLLLSFFDELRRLAPAR